MMVGRQALLPLHATRNARFIKTEFSLQVNYRCALIEARTNVDISLVSAYVVAVVVVATLCDGDGGECDKNGVKCCISSNSSTHQIFFTFSSPPSSSSSSSSSYA